MGNKIKIEDLPKKTPYSLPEGYFDTLNSNINLKIDKIEGKKSRIIKWQKWTIAAAACVGLFFGINIWNNNQAIRKSEHEIAKIDNAQILVYLKNENVEIADLDENAIITNNEVQNLLIEDLNINDIEVSNDLDTINL